MTNDLNTDDLRQLAESWMLTLRAERKSPATLKVYGDGIRAFLDYCDTEDLEPLRRASLIAFTNHVLDRGAKPATARSRQLAVRRFAKWLADPEEGDELDSDPFNGVKPPRLDQTEVNPLTDDELRAMLATCVPKRDTEPRVKFRQIRDAAILRLMIESALRAGEVVALTVADVDLDGGVVTVRQGKGGKERRVPIGAVTVKALDKYKRSRRTHRLAETEAFWLGDRSKFFNYDALHQTLKRRAAEAGVEGFHPHRLRHTAAHRWLAAGGSESGLQAVAGWTRPDMLHRYTKARATDRALEEARKLNLGEL